LLVQEVFSEDFQQNDFYVFYNFYLNPAFKGTGAIMNNKKGYSLIELMVIILILGVLATVAIPTFLKYIRKAKTAEAEDKVSLIYRSAVSYFGSEQVTREGKAVGNMFPVSADPTPGENLCCNSDDGRCDPKKKLMMETNCGIKT